MTLSNRVKRDTANEIKATQGKVQSRNSRIRDLGGQIESLQASTFYVE